jgi:type IV secretory pathway VirB10-like protein
MTDERRRDDHADDVRIDAAWRKASRDEPPARVDATILAAARAETRRVAPGPGIAARRAWWTRWQPLAAAAGVAGLAFVLIQTIPREAPLRPPAAVETNSRAESSVARPIEPEVAPAAAEPVPAPPSRPAPPPQPAQQTVPTREVAASPAVAAASAESDALASAAPRAAAQADAAATTPGAWARRIAALHAAGDLDAAAAELREFRLAFPDADRFLPDDLHAWAAGVPRPDAP